MNGQLLLALALIAPLAGALVAWAFAAQPKRNLAWVNLISTSFSLICIVLAVVGRGGQDIVVQLANAPMAFNLELNSLSAFFALLFLGAWTATSIYSFGYMEKESANKRFYVFLQLTLLGCLGVVMASDFLTLFVFFEMMSLCSYVLVIHKEDAGAMQAGSLYLTLGVIGGLALLLGIVFLKAGAGTAGFVPLAPGTMRTGMVLTMGFAFFLGFAIKAGLFPLHIWLPSAHPMAPTPASALLSGIMIKTGAYGLFRVFYTVLAPPGQLGVATDIFGWLLLGLGLITMVLGAFLAFFQDQVKKTLAYSSISQIGYIVMGLGAAVLPFGHDYYGISGMLFHILNHGIFKTTLFLCAGAIYLYTHNLDYDNLGGLLRKYPLLTTAFVVGALGITGMPGFNGYGSKTLLHHALTDLYSANPSWLLWLAEKLYVLASALTICYFVKLFINIFLGKKDWSHLPARMSFSLQLPLSLGAIAIIGIGIFPLQIVQKLIIPAMRAIGFEEIGLEHVATINFWNGKDLSAMAITFSLAAIILLFVMWFKLGSLKLPQRLSLEDLVYKPIATGFISICKGSVFGDILANGVCMGLGAMFMGVCRGVAAFDGAVDRLYLNTGRALVGLVGAGGAMDRKLNDIYSYVGRSTLRGFGSLGFWEEKLGLFFKKVGRLFMGGARTLDGVERRLSLPVQREKQGKMQRLQKAIKDFSGKLSRSYVELLLVVVILVVMILIYIYSSLGD
jgi:formate hydrogenlyase subunit 3/multisubunit Na+/H+ antiporter MnhD subunit